MSAHGYIYVTNWDGPNGFQHYKDRPPRWIKLHLSLLGNDDFLALTPADRMLLIGIWMVTARYGNGRVPADSGWLNAQFKTRKGSLVRLNDAGFIDVRASKAGAAAEQSDRAEGSKEPKREKEREEHPIVRLAAAPVDKPAPRDIETVWARYEHHHPLAKLTTARRGLIARRLKDYPATMLIAAIDGNHNDPHCNGENASGKQYHDLELILRDAGHVEKYASLATGDAGGRRRVSPEEIEETRRLMWAQN